MHASSPEHELLADLQRRWRDRLGVVGIGLGTRHRGGEYEPGELCVVVTVVRKLPTEAIPARRRFPPSVTLGSGRGRVELPVDVQETDGQGFHLQGFLGARVDAQNGTHGALSLFVRDASGVLGLVSGHVAGFAGTHIRMPWGVRGRTRNVWWSGAFDHATVELPAAPASSAMETAAGTRIVGVRTVTPDLVGAVITMYLPTRHQNVAATVRQVFASRRSPDVSGGMRWVDGLVGIDPVSSAGDSGALAYDPQTGLAVGTLLGSDGVHTFFIPCEPALARLGLTIA